MALTRDRATAYREGIEIEYPVAAVKIYAGGMVCINAAGYAAPAADTVNFKFVGIALEQVDNSAGQAGDKTIRVRRVGVVEFKASSIAQGDVGKQMYVVNDETFDETNPGQGIICGVLTKFVSATKGWLDIGSGVKPTLAAASADALTVSDAGDHFPAAIDTVPEQIQALAATVGPIKIRRQTGWVKDGTDKQAVGPKMEFPFPVRIKRAYGYLGTVPGAGKALVVKFGASTLLTFGAADQWMEDEALDVAVAANTDLLSAAGGFLLNETAAGAGDNLDLDLIVELDDGV
jgi:hypothetical protein